MIILVCVFNIAIASPVGITKKIPLNISQIDRVSYLQSRETVNSEESGSQESQDYIFSLCSKSFGGYAQMAWTVRSGK